MPKFDRAFAEEKLQRLASLPADAQPAWGKMNRDELYGHLRVVMLHMLGKGPALPFRGNWKSRYIFRPLILSGIVAIPQNIKLPRPVGAPKDMPAPTCTFDELRAAVLSYVDGIEKGTLKPAMHPFFGELPVEDWRKFHVHHFKHHMKQFGIWD